MFISQLIFIFERILTKRMSSSPSADMEAFRKVVQQARRVVILTGAGVSAESGVPTFRGAGGLWRTFNAVDLATPMAFRSNPSLVWEFYHHRRENMASKSPNNVFLSTSELLFVLTIILFYYYRLIKQLQSLSTD